jgi:hypothetical protein
MPPAGGLAAGAPAAPPPLPAPLLPPPLPPFVPVEASFARRAPTAELSFALPPAQAHWRVVGWRRDASGALKLVLQPPPAGGAGTGTFGVPQMPPPPVVALAHPGPQQAAYAAAAGAHAAAAAQAAAASAGRQLALSGAGSAAAAAQNPAANAAAAAAAATAAAAAAAALPAGIYPPLAGCAAAVLALAPCGLSASARAFAAARGLTSVAALARTTHAQAVAALGPHDTEALIATLHAFAQGAWRVRAAARRRNNAQTRAFRFELAKKRKPSRKRARVLFSFFFLLLCAIGGRRMPLAEAGERVLSSVDAFLSSRGEASRRDFLLVR